MSKTLRTILCTGLVMFTIVCILESAAFMSRRNYPDNRALRKERGDMPRRILSRPVAEHTSPSTVVDVRILLTISFRGRVLID